MIYYFTILYLFYIRIGGFKDLFSRSPMWEGDYICVLLICFGDIRIVQEVLQKVLGKWWKMAVTSHFSEFRSPAVSCLARVYSSHQSSMGVKWGITCFPIIVLFRMMNRPPGPLAASEVLRNCTSTSTALVALKWLWTWSSGSGGHGYWILWGPARNRMESGGETDLTYPYLSIFIHTFLPGGEKSWAKFMGLDGTWSQLISCHATQRDQLRSGPIKSR